MDNPYQEVEHARVQYGDWVGTTAADEHLTIGHRSIHEVVGLDHDRWWILAIDVHTTDLANGGFYVLAVDRDRDGIDNYEKLHEYGKQHGSIPVTSFLVHDIGFAELTDESFTQLGIQLRHRSLESMPLTVVHQDDLNYSGD